MLNIQDRLQLQLFFNDKEFPFHRVNVLDFLHISASSKIALPMIHLRVKDAIGWMAKNALFDGVKIRVVLSAKERASQQYTFRLNSFKETRQGDFLIYDVDGYLNFPLYWNGSHQGVIRGSSTAAIEEIAGLCGLKTDLDSTSNSQAWLPANRRYHDWLREIAATGFANDSSCMVAALDVDGTLRYKNINAAKPAQKTISLVVPVRGTLHGISHKPKAASGTANWASGYQSARVQQNPLNEIPFRAHNRVDVSNDEKGKLMLNGEVKSNVRHGKVKFGPINPGNVDESYERGGYQNIRLMRLFSTGMDVLFDTATGLQLLYPVDVVTPDHPNLKPYSGRHVVASRTIYVSGIDYYEKIELVRKTLNVNAVDQTTSDAGELYTDYEF